VKVIFLALGLSGDRLEGAQAAGWAGGGTMAEFRLTLLGAFGLSGGASCEVLSKKAQALLAYIALAPDRAHRREKLASLLWSDRLEESARQNLRQCLTAIRRACDGAKALPIIIENDTIRLDPGIVAVDVGEFEQAAQSHDADKLAQALTLYRGELLEGLDLQAEPLEEWLVGERRRLRNIAVEGLGRLLTHRQRSGDRERAMQVAMRLLAIDPALEHVHRALMQLYHEGGNTAHALKQYAICEKILRRELGVEPEAATRDLRNQILRSRRSPSSGSGPERTEADRDPSSALRSDVPPGRPRQSIVVLPFANLGGDRQHDDFVDAITEDLTTDISGLPDMFVISCKTAFAYKGRAMDVRQIGRELGVRYVLEGSVQSRTDSLRVNAQLIDAETGAHLWAERFDKPWANLFDMQDEIVARLARTMDVQLVAVEARRLEREEPKDLDSVDLALRGHAVFYHNVSVAGAREARGLFEQALRIDGMNVDVLLGLVETNMLEVNAYMSPARAEQIRVAEAAMSKASELAPRTARLHFTRAGLLVAKRTPEQALREIELAMSLDRDLPYVHMGAGWVRIYLGRAEETASHIATAMRLSPRDRMLGSWYQMLGSADLLLGKLDEAVDHLQKAVEIAPNLEIPYFYLAAALALQGHRPEAARICEAGRRLAPIFRIGKCRAEAQSDNPIFLAQRERVYEGLGKAGLPE
jgi:TolB-like protein/DNA-binding SARP family transcriptional activator